jgi:hypothetical protein
VPAVILFVGLFFFPYSPRWLASKDRWEEAIRVLANLHGDGDINHPKELAEYQEIEEALRFEREEAVSSYKQLVAPRMFKSSLECRFRCGVSFMGKFNPTMWKLNVRNLD